MHKMAMHWSIVLKWERAREHKIECVSCFILAGRCVLACFVIYDWSDYYCVYSAE